MRFIAERACARTAVERQREERCILSVARRSKDARSPRRTGARRPSARTRCAPTHLRVGGPVALKAGATIFDWGLYFCEVAPFAPSIAARALPQLSGANLSYKRAALEAARDLLDDGQWDSTRHLSVRLDVLQEEAIL